MSSTISNSVMKRYYEDWIKRQFASLRENEANMKQGADEPNPKIDTAPEPVVHDLFNRASQHIRACPVDGGGYLLLVEEPHRYDTMGRGERWVRFCKDEHALAAGIAAYYARKRMRGEEKAKYLTEGYAGSMEPKTNLSTLTIGKGATFSTGPTTT